MQLNKLFLALLFVLVISLRFYGQPPAGYYDDAAGLSGAELKTALHNIINNHTVVTYPSIWTHFQTTDAKPNGMVWDIYSDLPGDPPYEYTFVEDQCSGISYLYEDFCYNRDHSWPRSWYGPGGNEILPMHTDLFHVYPVDAWVNSLKSNYPLGEVSDPETITLNGSKLGLNSTPGYNGTVFEPIDEYKGDLARTYFYMATRYEDLVADWNTNSDQADAVLDGTAFPVFEPWFLDLLMAWHEADPVSQKEIDRNNAIYSIQGNRNPFIDYPEYVQMIWGDGLSQEPESHVSGFSATSITLSWTDAGGPLQPEAYLVRMSNLSFDDIEYPVNGVEVADDFRNKNVPYGKEFCTFGGLTPGTTYYFKIFGYRTGSHSIVYKTGDHVPAVSIKAK